MNNAKKQSNLLSFFGQHAAGDKKKKVQQQVSNEDNEDQKSSKMASTTTEALKEIAEKKVSATDRYPASLKSSSPLKELTTALKASTQQKRPLKVIASDSEEGEEVLDKSVQREGSSNELSKSSSSSTTATDKIIQNKENSEDAVEEIAAGHENVDSATKEKVVSKSRQKQDKEEKLDCSNESNQSNKVNDTISSSSPPSKNLPAPPQKKAKIEASTSSFFTSSKKPKPNQSNDYKITYGDLCKVFEEIESTTKRLIILDYLVEFLVSVIKKSPQSLLPVIYLCLNKLAPEYQGIELGIGESLLVKAIALSSGQSTKSVKNELTKVGDLGDVAQQCKSKQKTMFAPKTLYAEHVFKSLKEIAMISGSSSQQKKVDKINALMVSCTESEPKYLIRSLEGKLRIGLAEQSVLVAIGHAFVWVENEGADKEKLQPKLDEAAATVKSVYNELPDYDLIIPALLEHGVWDLPKHCTLSPGIPLKPMLAHPTKSLTEVLDRFEGIEFTCEFKYDGERAQIHKLEDGSAMIFSRNSENLSAKYPDILNRIPNISKENTTSYVLDCEAVAWDTEKKSILPFQVLSTRKRKDVNESDIKVQPVTGYTLKERRQLMQNHFNVIEGEFLFAKYINSRSIEEIQTFLDDSVTGNCEGLMIKTLDTDSTYEPSKRSRNWLKVKKDYLSGVGDTVDLVVIGAYTGRGKRTGVYGGYLLACYDNYNDEYQSICKIGTGFSDQDLATQAEFFKNHIIAGPKPYYKVGDNPNIVPDVWFDPVQVWEVKCADLSISPVHKAAMGIVDESKGISLRFPRFIRIRDDKKPEQATNAEQIATLYKSQQVVSNNFKEEDDE